MARLLGEMAHGRDKYRDNVRHHVVGAFGEYLKHRIALDAGLKKDKKNGHLIAHWDDEWQRLLMLNFVPALRTQVKFKKSGRLPTALGEVTRLRDEENADIYVEWARKQVNKDFGVDIRKPVTPDTARFWQEVDDVIRTALPI